MASCNVPDGTLGFATHQRALFSSPVSGSGAGAAEHGGSVETSGGLLGITTGGLSGAKENPAGGGKENPAGAGTVWGDGGIGFFTTFAGVGNPMEERKDGKGVGLAGYGSTSLEELKEERILFKGFSLKDSTLVASYKEGVEEEILSMGSLRWEIMTFSPIRL